MRIINFAAAAMLGAKASAQFFKVSDPDGGILGEPNGPELCRSSRWHDPDIMYDA